MSAEKEHIGTLIPKPFGFRAKCALCHWTSDATGQSARQEADRSMRFHAEVVHPQSIPVYREVPS